MGSCRRRHPATTGRGFTEPKTGTRGLLAVALPFAFLPIALPTVGAISFAFLAVAFAADVAVAFTLTLAFFAVGVAADGAVALALSPLASLLIAFPPDGPVALALMVPLFRMPVAADGLQQPVGLALHVHRPFVEIGLFEQLGRLQQVLGRRVDQLQAMLELVQLGLASFVAFGRRELTPLGPLVVLALLALLVLASLTPFVLFPFFTVGAFSLFSLFALFALFPIAFAALALAFFLVVGAEQERRRREV